MAVPPGSLANPFEEGSKRNPPAYALERLSIHTTRNGASTAAADTPGLTASRQEHTSTSASGNYPDPQACGEDLLDRAVPTLNKAILLFQQHKYLSAVGLLEPLYTHVDTLDAGTAIRVCFLLIDIYLRFRQLSLANEVINYLQQALPAILQSIPLQPTGGNHTPGSPASNIHHTAQHSSTGTKPEASTAPQPKNGPIHYGPRSITLEHVPDNGVLPPTAKCITPKPWAGGLMSHPVSVSQGPSPNISITSQGQPHVGRDASCPDTRNGRCMTPVGFTGYVAALGVELPTSQGDDGGDGEREQGAEGTGLQCAPGAAVLCLPYLSQLTGAVVQKAQQLEAGVADELIRWEVDVKVAIRVYKAQLHLLNNNTKAAKRELKFAVGSGASKQLTALMKAQLEMCRGNFVKASRLMVALVQDPDVFTSSPLQLLNNLGVLHHHMGQHQTAALYFSKALQHNKRQAAPQEGKTHSPAAPPMDLSPALLYNAGLQQLMVKNHMLALKCFRWASCYFYYQPLLWLRLAESAVGVASGLQPARQEAGAGKGPAAENAAAGANDMFSRALTSAGLSSLLDPSYPGNAGGVMDALEPQQQAWTELHDTSAGGYLQYAQNCLDVSLVLLDTSHHESFAPEAHSPHLSAGRSGGSIDATLDSPRDASNGVRSPHPNGRNGDPGEESEVVRAAVLALASYISLQQEHYDAALTAAKSLLALPSLKPSHHFLGVCYAAEALCRLGMTNEAMELLTQNMESMAVEAEEREHEVRTSLGNAHDLELLTGPKARSTMYVNMAAVYITQGDWTAAAHCAEQANQLCPSPHTGLLQVYIELARGNTTAALAALKMTAPKH